MAISLNTFSKNGLASLIRTNNGIFGSPNRLYLYPTSVAMPTTPYNSGYYVNAPAGRLVEYNTQLTFSLTGNTIYISAGTTSANALDTGTMGWWLLSGTSSGLGMIHSDSIGLSGEGKIITVNTMTPFNGQSVTVTFNLTLV